jgi:hypothetical protein
MMGQAKLKERAREQALKPGLPPIPPRMQHLPIDERGFPTPWFVAWLNEARTKELPPGRGRPDFRVIGGDRIARAVRHQVCWICGQRLLSQPVACVLGPMCSINRISSEPPSHVQCARFAVRACPFLTRPQMKRREGGLDAFNDDTPGIAIDRNPGVTLLWQTNEVQYDIATRLFDVGEPVAVEWFAHGRPATRDEIMDSILSGLPILREVAGREEGGLAELERRTAAAMELVPAS